MRYWFNEPRNEIFALEVPPPDLKDTIEISVEDYAEYVAAVHAEKQKAAPAPAPPPEPVATVDMEKLARVWRKMQDKRDELRHAFEAEDKRIEEQQKQVSSALNGAMAQMGLSSAKTAAGVIERKQKLVASAADWEAVYRFIVENDAWELLHKRLGTRFIESWAKSHDGAAPPGVNVKSEFVVSVKKPGSKELPNSED